MMNGNAIGRRTYRVSAAVTVCLCASVMSAACRAAGSAPPAEVVRYDARQLYRHEGVAALYVRLRLAAERVCASAEPDWHFRQLTTSWCVAEATRRAIAMINAPALTQFHQTKAAARSD